MEEKLKKKKEELQKIEIQIIKLEEKKKIIIEEIEKIEITMMKNILKENNLKFEDLVFLVDEKNKN